MRCVHLIFDRNIQEFELIEVSSIISISELTMNCSTRCTIDLSSDLLESLVVKNFKFPRRTWFNIKSLLKTFVSNALAAAGVQIHHFILLRYKIFTPFLKTLAFPKMKFTFQRVLFRFKISICRWEFRHFVYRFVYSGLVGKFIAIGLLKIKGSLKCTEVKLGKLRSVTQL